MGTATKSLILYIDDDDDDFIFLRSSLEDAGNKADLICANDGEEAIEYLNNTPPTSLPSLIVLDLNMPRWDGRRMLSYIKAQPRLSSIPVIILSTSDSDVEKEACAQLGAASYIKKPFHYEGYKKIIANFFAFLNILPA